MTGAPCSSFSSLSQNWSISSSSDKREEAVFSLGAAALGRARWRGSSTGGRSFWARKPGIETSILHSRRSPALMALPTSWKASDSGSKSRMRWTALNCPSSLINTSDLRILLRPATLTKLRRGAICFLSAKISEEQKHGQTNKTYHQRKMKC